jgi:hypothetical protein
LADKIASPFAIKKITATLTTTARIEIEERKRERKRGREEEKKRRWDSVQFGCPRSELIESSRDCGYLPLLRSVS